MPEAISFNQNFLQRHDRAALVVVKVDPQGKPDTITYWQKRGAAPSLDEHYVPGSLVDISV